MKVPGFETEDLTDDEGFGWKRNWRRIFPVLDTICHIFISFIILFFIEMLTATLITSFY